jgi:predicted transcriptional regulator
VTPEGIAAVEAIVKENHPVTLIEIAAHLDMSHGSVHHILRDVLQFRKVFKELRDKKYLRFSFDSP